MKVTSINGVVLDEVTNLFNLNIKEGDLLTGYYNECESNLNMEWEVVLANSVIPNALNIVTPEQKPYFATVLQVNNIKQD